MQHTTCTEDRIHHALERCLHGLSRSSTLSASTWTAGFCLNCWSLQELVSRDAGNYLILLEKILQKTQEKISCTPVQGSAWATSHYRVKEPDTIIPVQEKCDYDLFTPLALLFGAAVLCIPHFPSDSDLLLRAIKTYSAFLTWPVPYCDICQELLTFISNELKAPGVSYQRLVRAEQGLPLKSCESSTVTVLLLNPSEVDGEFLSVAERLSTTEHSQHMLLLTLVEHIYQANFGTQCDLGRLRQALKLKPVEELLEIFASTTDAQEMAVASSSDPSLAREQLESALLEIAKETNLPVITGEDQASRIRLIPIPFARCYAYRWDTDNFDVLNEVLDKEGYYPKPVMLEDEEEADSCFHERASLLSNLASVSKNSVYLALSEDSPCDSRASVFSTLSKDLELPLASKKTFKFFVSSLKNCMDSGYVEDSDEGSQELMSRLDPKEEEEEEEEEKASPRHRHRLGNKLYKLFKSKSQLILGRELNEGSRVASLSLPLRRAESLCNPLAKERVPTRSRRAQSLPQHVLSATLAHSHASQNTCFQRRPFLSCDEETKVSTLRVVVFGSDRISGKVARAYSSLKAQESSCPWLTRHFKLQFHYVPVKRSGSTSSLSSVPPPSPGDPHSRTCGSVDPGLAGMEGSTNDISLYIGLLDPWYERNVLGLMNLPTSVLCQQSIKSEGEPLEEPAEQLPILADIILYYCRFATRPVLLQVYQAELTFIGGQKKTEIFIHSLELGHSAATRAIKASGPGCKRLGIDGDREAIPLTLQIAYSKRSVSGRGRWNDTEKVCTSVNLSKACKKPEELGSKTECLTLTATEVIKRQSSKSKKSFNQQISVSQIKVDKVQLLGVNCSFAVCLDQDERKILQSVTRCEVSPCFKPKTSLGGKPTSSLPPHESSDFCSLLCLPIATFSGALP